MTHVELIEKMLAEAKYNRKNIVVCSVLSFKDIDTLKEIADARIEAFEDLLSILKGKNDDYLNYLKKNY